MHEGDRELVVRMQAGEQRAFDAFFSAYARRLGAFAARRSNLDVAAVEDIVQNSMIKAVRNLKTFRGEAALFTWLCEICRREIADARRKASRRPPHDSLDTEVWAHDEVVQLQAPAETEPPAEVQGASTRKAVVDTLNALPASYVAALEWKYGDGLSVEEIGQLLGITSVAAQSLLARAREAFRQHWRERVADDRVRSGGGLADDPP